MVRQSEQPVEPDWPNARDLDRYNHLTGRDIKEALKSGGTWIDIGPGDGAPAMRQMIGRPGVKLKAIGPHPRKMLPGIAFTLGSVPEDRAFLTRNRGKARLVTDIYGALSYCDNPLEALIYGALLLGKESVFVAFTELRRMGNVEAWDRMTLFFGEKMGQEISFQTKSVLGDASKRFETSLRIVVEGRNRATAKSFRDLLAASERAVGTAMAGNDLWVSSDGVARIRQVDYSGAAKSPAF